MKTLYQLQRYDPTNYGRGMSRDASGDYVKLSDVEAILEEQAYPYAWAITYLFEGTHRTQILRHNAIGDYRQLDPNATSTPLYLRSKQ